MVLKGAALHLTLHRNPGDRPMSDLDLMVPPKHAPRMLELLERLGGRLGRPLVRDDFFPRYHYERDVNWPGVTPLRVDLHAHPFRPLAYIRSVPPHAFWRGAERVRVGRAPVCVPNAEDMLLHLAVHCAVHGNQRRQWLTDLRQWVGWHRQRFDWSRFERTARDWGLHHAADVALDAAGARPGTDPPTRRAGADGRGTGHPPRAPHRPAGAARCHRRSRARADQCGVRDGMALPRGLSAGHALARSCAYGRVGTIIDMPAGWRWGGACAWYRPCCGASQVFGNASRASSCVKSEPGLVFSQPGLLPREAASCPG
jgi:hypothetical protein